MSFKLIQNRTSFKLQLTPIPYGSSNMQNMTFVKRAINRYDVYLFVLCCCDIQYVFSNVVTIRIIISLTHWL